jgi:hypothetical protein
MIHNLRRPDSEENRNRGGRNRGGRNRVAEAEEDADTEGTNQRNRARYGVQDTDRGPRGGQSNDLFHPVRAFLLAEVEQTQLQA